MTFMIFPTLSDLDLFSGIAYTLTKRSGEFRYCSSSICGRWKGRGRVEGWRWSVWEVGGDNRPAISTHGMQWRQWIWTYLWSYIYDAILCVRQIVYMNKNGGF